MSDWPDWRSPENAPKDGRRIMIRCENPKDLEFPWRICIARWDNPDRSGFGEMHWVTDSDGPAEFYDSKLSGWLPLPDLPRVRNA